MRNWKIAAKILVSFFIIAAAALAIGVEGFIALTQMKDGSTDMYQNQTVPIPYLSAVLDDVHSLNTRAYQAILYVDHATEYANLKEEIARYQSEYESNERTYGEQLQDEEAKALYTQARTVYDDTFSPALTKIIHYLDDKNVAMATVTLGALKTSGDQLVDSYSQCMTLRVKAAQAVNETNEHLAARWSVFQFLAAAAGVAAAIVLGLYLTRLLNRPIREMVGAAEGLSDGRLDVDVNYAAQDELGQLASKFEAAITLWRFYIDDITAHCEHIAGGDMTATTQAEYTGDFVPIATALQAISASLRDTLTDIRLSSEQVASGAQQVAGGSQTLAQGVADQASVIEELSATIDSMAETVKDNTQNVLSSGEAVREAVEDIHLGNRQMDKMLAAMEAIQASSHEIGNITKVVGDIAFQTNILALNAAVEAARAGASGKGFAVVASEVRTLAGRAAEASNQTAELLGHSLQNVESGVQIAQETATALRSADVKAQRVSDAIRRIDASSNAQSAAVGQITQSIAQIASVVRINSATAEQSAAASEELSTQAALLRSAVSRFKLDADQSDESGDTEAEEAASA